MGFDETFLLLPIENLNSNLFLYINKNAKLSFVSFFTKTHEENACACACPGLTQSHVILQSFWTLTQSPFEKTQHSLLHYFPCNLLKSMFLVCLCMCVWNVNVECECICACQDVMVNYGSQVSPSNTWVLQAPLQAKPRWLGLLC